MLKLFKKRNNKPLPMQPNNILLISSSARQLDELINFLIKTHRYTTNSDIIRLDNGDFAQVIKGSTIER